MKKPATPPTPPPANAPAGPRPASDPRPAGPGSGPETAAVDRIRVMTRETGILETEVEKTRRELVAPEEFVRSMLHPAVSMRVNLYEVSVDDLFARFKKQNEDSVRNPPCFEDYQEAYDRFTAVQSALTSKQETLRQKNSELLELLNVEGPRLASVMADRYDALRAEISKGILPYCEDGQAEATELAEQTSRLRSLQGRQFFWQAASGTAAVRGASFLSAWEAFNASPLNPSQG